MINSAKEEYAGGIRLLHVTVIAIGGQLICGDVVSEILIVKLQLEVFPQASVAVHVTSVEPELKVTPFNVLRLFGLVVAPVKVNTTIGMEQLSVAVASHKVPV